MTDDRDGPAASLYGPGTLDSLSRVCEELFPGRRFAIVSDGRIWPRLEPRLARFLSDLPPAELIILPAEPRPYASDGLVAAVRERIGGTGRGSGDGPGFEGRLPPIPVAVGAGTINDIVKRASFELGLRYVCVPTAPSVDGFASFGASICVGGFKRTLECPAPLAIVADEEVLAEAPAELVASGFGDLLAKLAGGADWIVADALGIEAIDGRAWELAQAPARDILPRARDLRARDRGAIAALYRGLESSGAAMRLYRDSRPVSGTEHLLSHCWEMASPGGGGSGAAHGFKVAVGTLLAASLAEELFSPTGEAGRALAERGFEPDRGLLERRLALCEAALPAGPISDGAAAAVRAKTPGPEGLERRAHLAREAWPRLRESVAAQLPPVAALRDALREAGCPTEPADIGLREADVRRALALAPLIRSRYIIPDLAAELGVLEACAEGALRGRRFAEPDGAPGRDAGNHAHAKE